MLTTARARVSGRTRTTFQKKVFKLSKGRRRPELVELAASAVTYAPPLLLVRSAMKQPSDPARASVGPARPNKSTDQARRAPAAPAPVAAREWDVAHARALRALLTNPPAVLPNQVGDPLLPLQIGIWDAFLALLRPGAEPEALARALRAYTRSTGYFMACVREEAMRHDLDGRPVEPVSEEHRTGAVKAVQGRRRRSAAQQGVGAAAA